jgi:hypothetical protein
VISAKAQTFPKPNGAGSKNPRSKISMVPGAVLSQDKIRERAYELYESRGREPGQAEQDWLRAEQEILIRSGSPTISAATGASAEGRRDRHGLSYLPGSESHS